MAGRCALHTLLASGARFASEALGLALGLLEAACGTGGARRLAHGGLERALCTRNAHRRGNLPERFGLLRKRAESLELPASALRARARARAAAASLLVARGALEIARLAHALPDDVLEVEGRALHMTLAIAEFAGCLARGILVLALGARFTRQRAPRGLAATHGTTNALALRVARLVATAALVLLASIAHIIARVRASDAAGLTRGILVLSNRTVRAGGGRVARAGLVLASGARSAHAVRCLREGRGFILASIASLNGLAHTVGVPRRRRLFPLCRSALPVVAAPASAPLGGSGALVLAVAADRVVAALPVPRACVLLVVRNLGLPLRVEVACRQLVAHTITCARRGLVLPFRLLVALCPSGAMRVKPIIVDVAARRSSGYNRAVVVVVGFVIRKWSCANSKPATLKEASWATMF